MSKNELPAQWKHRENKIAKLAREGTPMSTKLKYALSDVGLHMAAADKARGFDLPMMPSGIHFYPASPQGFGRLHIDLYLSGPKMAALIELITVEELENNGK